jgi:hypothetical protein
VKKKIIILLSVLISIFLASGGYSLWEKSLTITGTIVVLEPTPKPKEPKTLGLDGVPGLDENLGLNGTLGLDGLLTVPDIVYQDDATVIDAVYGIEIN